MEQVSVMHTRKDVIVRFPPHDLLSATFDTLRTIQKIGMFGACIVRYRFSDFRFYMLTYRLKFKD